MKNWLVHSPHPQLSQIQTGRETVRPFLKEPTFGALCPPWNNLDHPISGFTTSLIFR
jgi:hypothetical protein